ncbi:hypothetical protein ROHU_027917 [Labeo rohita]|uniref:Uncharacterized protein n=1 Tax=Labeo rohita TaxID=84645 RepID=A0A498ME36_LABRO|nr:hypothetical protein ROHU_027917 [Labeo rohita]
MQKSRPEGRSDGGVSAETRAEAGAAAWQVTAADTRNYKHTPQHQRLLYDIITQYSAVFSTSAAQNTALAALSDPLLIYKSKENVLQ